MFEGKTVLVTGASRGIGKGIALKFAEHEAFVGINYIAHTAEAKATLHEIQNKGGRGMLLKGDISDADHVEHIVSKLINQRDQIDILVNNAGVYQRGSFEDLPFESWKRSLEVNLTSCYHLCKQVVPFMKSTGKIIFISSQLAFKGSSHGAAYAASKAGILGLMRSLALELAEQDICVNAVAPGTIETDLLSGYSDEMKVQRRREIPLGRLGTPEDIANVCVFLASSLSDYITGETIHVNGGLYIH